jgi:hypothetical protein
MGIGEIGFSQIGAQLGLGLVHVKGYGWVRVKRYKITPKICRLGIKSDGQ